MPEKEVKRKEKEWNTYRVIPPPSVKPFNNLCRPFSRVFHITHLNNSYQILDNNSIIARRVADKSRLNTKRILVVWLSPNDWNAGSLYGNISFEYEFSEIIRNRNYYWVEVMTDYEPHACRILITNNEYDFLETYDPRISDGPWWFDEEHNTHFRNGEYTLEFMLESDLQLTECNDLQFVSHHPDLCNIKHTQCIEKELTGMQASSYFLAKVLAEEFPLLNQLFRRQSNDKMQFNTELQKAYNNIYVNLSEKVNFTGAITQTDRVALPLLKSILNIYSSKDRINTKYLAGLYSSRADAIGCLNEIVRQRLGITHPEQ